MQSFAGKVKNELCRTPVQRLCCARAEAYGVLLYGNTFSPTEVRLITESADFAARLPRLFQRAFSLKFDSLPDGTRDKLIFRITQRHKLARIVDLLGYDPSLVLHVNFGLLEDECCRTAFVRGAFLAGGSVTDPAKRYHLELATSHLQVSRELEVLLRDGYRLLRLADSLSTVECYELPPNAAVFPLWQQLQECLESTRLLLGANGRTLCYDLPEENDMVRGDAEMLMRAILHLICNGLDAADDAVAPVTVRGSVAGDQAILTILDEGRGIPPEQLEEVFTPYRSHDKDGLPYQSPGLGLPLARRVLEAHGGSLRLISSEGGTAAVCSLPLCRELPTLLRSTAPHYLEDIFSPLYTILCDYITPPWPYPQP